MSFSRFRLTPLVCAVLSLIASSQAQDSLTPAGGFSPVFTFTETHAEKIVVITDPADSGVKYAEVHSVDAMTLNFKANMSGQALADIGADTGFSLQLGDLGVGFSLGDDPNYKPGDTAAFIPAHGWDANNNPIGTEGLALSWTESVLTVKMVNSADTEEDQGPFYPAFSRNFIGETNPNIRALGALSFSFGSITGDAAVYLKGAAATVTKHFSNQNYSDDLSLTQASFSGELDFAPPTVTITRTVDNSTAANDDPWGGGDGVTLFGTAMDGHGVAAVEVSSAPDDDSSWQQANIDSFTPLADGAEWSADTVHWSFDFWEAGIGVTTVSVRATDLSGNVSALTTFKVVRNVPSSLAGRWDALVNTPDGNVPSGALTFNVAATGAVSGKLTLADSGRTFPFTGAWTADRVTAVIARPGLTWLTFTAIAPSIDTYGPEDAWLDGELAEISAPTATTVTRRVGSRVASVIRVVRSEADAAPSDADPVTMGVFGAFRSPFSATQRVPTELTGRYNASVSGPLVDAALGSSFISLNARPAGSALIAGRLSDGTPLIWSGVIGAAGEIPVYLPIYSKKGLFAALLTIDGESVNSDTGLWQRPAGLPDHQFPEGFIADALSVAGQRYTPPPAGERVLDLADGDGNANINLSGDGLDADLNLWFTVDARNHATFDAPNTEGLRVNFAAATGNVTGAFKLPNGPGLTTSKSVNFTGLIVGDQAVGFYIAPPAAGATAARYGSVSISGDPASQAGNDGSGDWSNWWDGYSGGSITITINGNLGANIAPIVVVPNLDGALTPTLPISGGSLTVTCPDNLSLISIPADLLTTTGGTINVGNSGLTLGSTINLGNLSSYSGIISSSGGILTLSGIATGTTP